MVKRISLRTVMASTLVFCVVLGVTSTLRFDVQFNVIGCDERTHADFQESQSISSIEQASYVDERNNTIRFANWKISRCAKGEMSISMPWWQAIGVDPYIVYVIEHTSGSEKFIMLQDGGNASL